MLVVFAQTLYLYPYFSVAAALAFCLGISVAPIMIASNTIVHNASDDQMRGKIFSSLEIIMHLGFLVFMLLSSILAERFSHVLILSIVGIFVSILGVVNSIYYRKIPWSN
jgi:MFS family permease